jgi:phenylacetate-CoA ligase
MRWDAHVRGWAWNGYIPGKRIAIITSAQGIIRADNTLDLSGDLSRENLRENAEKIRDFKPQHVRGYVSSLYIFAKYCLDNDIELHGIESVNPISENLYDFQREVIESAFRSRAFEEYVCNDGGTCAWECEAHEGLHYFMERAIIEEVDGEMLSTDLWNKAMPFIRYKNGDSVILLNKKCSCGRQLPLIKVKGRNNDIIITREGPLSPSFLLHHGIGCGSAQAPGERFRSGISAVQYVQKPGFVLEVNFVKNPWCTLEELERFRADLSALAKGMTVRVNQVDAISATPKGKRAFIINEDKELLKKYLYLT